MYTYTRARSCARFNTCAFKPTARRPRARAAHTPPPPTRAGCASTPAPPALNARAPYALRPRAARKPRTRRPRSTHAHARAARAPPSVRQCKRGNPALARPSMAAYLAAPVGTGLAASQTDRAVARTRWRSSSAGPGQTRQRGESRFARPTAAKSLATRWRHMHSRRLSWACVCVCVQPLAQPLPRLCATRGRALPRAAGARDRAPPARHPRSGPMHRPTGPHCARKAPRHGPGRGARS